MSRYNEESAAHLAREQALTTQAQTSQQALSEEQRKNALGYAELTQTRQEMTELAASNQHYSQETASLEGTVAQLEREKTQLLLEARRDHDEMAARELLIQRARSEEHLLGDTQLTQLLNEKSELLADKRRSDDEIATHSAKERQLQEQLTELQRQKEAEDVQLRNLANDNVQMAVQCSVLRGEQQHSMIKRKRQNDFIERQEHPKPPKHDDATSTSSTGTGESEGVVAPSEEDYTRGF